MLDNPDFSEKAVLKFITDPKVAPTQLLPDKGGYTPLHYALRILRPAVVELLVSKGASLLHPDPEGRTALHYIAKQCLYTKSKRSYGQADTDRTEYEWRARDQPRDYFDQCVRLWNKYIAEEAAAKRCSESEAINIRDSKDNTPFLVYVGSDDQPPKQPYQLFAAESEDDDQEMKAKPEEDSSKHKICHLKYLDVLFPRDSKTRVVDFHCANNEGQTALHIVAAREQNKPQGRYNEGQGEHDRIMFEELVTMGLDPLKEDAQDRSALDVAAACGKEDIVGLFRRKG